MSSGPRQWISTAELAAAVGVSRRAMSKAALLALTFNRQWRGKVLEVRPVLSRGGRSGRTYEVAIESLPEAFKSSVVLSSSRPKSGGEYRPRLVKDDRRNSRYAIIAAAVDHPPGTPQRREAMALAAGTSGKSLKTISRWCAEFDQGGITALGRAKPVNAGKRRYAVSAPFDKAFLAKSFTEAELEAIGRHMDNQIRGLWASRAADSGWADVNRLAEQLLQEHCESIGKAVPQAAYRIGRHGIERHRAFAIVNLRRNNAKAYQDQLPAISRRWSDLEPMEIVVADVKHLDVKVTRPDGTTAFPKMIAFVDGGTQRIFSYLVLCEQRRSITQELVIEAFIAMACDPAWGFPQSLYLDNGSEFGGLDRIQAALAMLNNNAGREIIRAKPYSARSKPIEGHFARTDRYCFASMPGYAGGDRQSKKTQNVGREPEAYAGSWEAFCAEVAGLIDYYHTIKIGGQWNASPNDIFANKVAAGWQAIMADPLALDLAFATRKSAKVQRGIISLGSKKFYHPELARLPTGTQLALLVPFRRAEAPIADIPGIGPARLVEELLYHPRDIEGAREAGRRQRAQQRAITAMARSVPEIDPVAIKSRIAAKHRPPAPPARPQVIDHGSTIEPLANAPQLAHLAGGEDRAMIEARRLEAKIQRLTRRKTSAAA